MTKYQPVHVSGRRGPCFDSLTEATLYTISQPDPENWHVEPVLEGAEVASS